jgi:Phytanoyl-CoA dioxygenase (PhyH)
MPEITEADYQHWRDHGYVVVKVLDDDQIEAALTNIYRYFPSWEEFAQARYRYTDLPARAAFPFVDDALNWHTSNPALLAFAERVLGTDKIMLGHSILMAKYAGTRDFAQNIHVDYQNNTLAYPKPDTEIFDFPVITYYTDVTVELGPTHLVPQDYTRERVLAPSHLGRDEAPELYEHEIAVTLPAGSTLMYSMNTWHRGSTMTATEGNRFSHHVTFTKASMTWAGQTTFQHEGGRPEMNHYIEWATPRQRELVGFPPVGDPYWDQATLAGVAARYPGMDMEPYLQAAG